MAKRYKKVVVTQAYFDLLKMSADMLDTMTDEGGDNGYYVVVDAQKLKELARVRKAWDKAILSEIDGSEPFVEPQ